MQGLLLHRQAAKATPGKDLEEGHELQLTDNESLTKSLRDLPAHLFPRRAVRALAPMMTAPSAPRNTESKSATHALPFLLLRLHPPKRRSKGSSTTKNPAERLLQSLDARSRGLLNVDQNPLLGPALQHGHLQGALQVPLTLRIPQVKSTKRPK